MKVIILNYMDVRNPRAGGAEKYCHEMARRLARRHVDVVWICSRFSGAPREEVVEGYKIIRIGNQYTIHALALIELLRVNQRDIIFESVNGVPFLFTLFFRSKKMRMIYHIVPYEAIKKKVGPFAPLVLFLQNKLTPLIYRRSVVLAGSSSVKADLRVLGFVNVKPVRIGGGGPPPFPAQTRERLVVSGGPIKPWKRVDHVIRAFSSLGDDWQLVVFGKFESIEYEWKLRNLVDQLGIRDRVKFLGPIDEKTKWYTYLKSKVLLIAPEKEGWGIVAMEAQSSGTPVVGYDVAGIRDSVQNGATGILVKDGDLEELKSALKRISSDEELLANFSVNAIRRSREYSWDNSYSDFENVLQSLM